MKRIVGAVLCLALVACNANKEPDFSAEDELMLTALSGEEEDFMRGPSDLTPDSAVMGQPLLFRACGVGPTHAALLAQYDTDGDGTLSDTERAALWTDRTPVERVHLVRRAFRWQRIQWIYDADETGDLELAERETLQADFTERCEVVHGDLLALFDINGDGQLSQPERVLLRAHRLEALLERRATLLENYDADESGNIDRTEAEAIREDLREAAEAVREAMVELFDANEDGHLDADERAAKREQQREWIRLGLNLRGV